MRNIFFTTFLLLPFNVLSLEVLCNFEEVYKNSDVQQGFFMIKNDKLRYEYYDKLLYKIIAKNNQIFLIQNNQINSFRVIDKNTQLITDIMKIISDFPNTKSYT